MSRVGRRRAGGLGLVAVLVMALLPGHVRGQDGSFCMANCTKPLFNQFCRVTEDVCAYPTGDKEAERAVRAVSIWRGQGFESECLQKFRTLICALYFPKCRYRITVPICWIYCYDAMLTCVRGHTYFVAEEVARARCLALVSTLQVADEDCRNGFNSRTGAECACTNAAPRGAPGGAAVALLVALTTVGVGRRMGW
eukprot:CAMPEP_0114132432 /NCGR_PEP_ID=MMETSP0043_2-20121206/13091_1 /TAXON_ID=464988 /ORGANISM="Hemiselmis andersenii, Strain CCMP644" /LENGTH=195 /DNA_ID=CAMNT_0001225945 /DNA_START=103 /DNA_END=693 /DNA_ORIENTATION=+